MKMIRAYNNAGLINFLSSSCYRISLTHTLLSVYLSLHHGWSLCPQHFDSLENVHCPFITHPLQDNTQSDEDTCPSHASTVYTKGNVLL